jgi:hypothetical protein
MVKYVGKIFFKPAIGNESLHDISNEDGVRVVCFPTFKKSYSQKYTVPTYHS